MRWDDASGKCYCMRHDQSPPGCLSPACQLIGSAGEKNACFLSLIFLFCSFHPTHPLCIPSPKKTAWMNRMLVAFFLFQPWSLAQVQACGGYALEGIPPHCLLQRQQSLEKNMLKINFKKILNSKSRRLSKSYHFKTVLLDRFLSKIIARGQKASQLGCYFHDTQ